MLYLVSNTGDANNVDQRQNISNIWVVTKLEKKYNSDQEEVFISVVSVFTGEFAQKDAENFARVGNEEMIGQIAKFDALQDLILDWQDKNPGKDHLKEYHRLAKIMDVDLSVANRHVTFQIHNNFLVDPQCWQPEI